MTVKINADTSDGLKIVSDTSGAIDFQSNGVTKMSMDASGNLTANSFVGVSEPSLVRLAGETLSANASSIEISASTLTTSYTNYELYTNLKPITDGGIQFLRLRDDSGILQANVSAYQQQNYRGGGTDFSDTSVSALTFISGTGNASGENVFAKYSIGDIRTSDKRCCILFSATGTTTAGTINLAQGGFITSVAEDNRGLQISFSSGDIASGSSYVLYGVKN